MSTEVSWLRGRVLQRVACDDDTKGWSFDFGAGCVLQVFTPWRFVKGSAIALGSCDHRHNFGLVQPVDAIAVALDLVNGRCVISAEVANSSSDLTADFGAGIRLEIFNSSSGYEGWSLTGPEGQLLVAQGGGHLAQWTGR